MADTLSELLSNVAAFKKGSETATAQVVNILGQQSSATADISAIYKQQATDDTTVAAAKNAADLQTQLSRVKAANALGTNLKSDTQIVTKLAEDAANAYEIKDAAMKEYTRKINLKLLDDPIEYIKAQFTINSDVTRHNAANAQVKAAEDRLAKINQLTQTTVMTQNAISEPLTAAAVAAANRTAAVAATVASKKTDIETLNYSVRAIEVALNSSKESLAVEFQAQGAKNAARSLQLSEENAAQSRIEFSYRQQEYQDRRADKMAQDDLGRSVVETVNLGRRALLQEKGTPLDDMSGKMVINALKTKGTLSDDMRIFYEAGERAKLAGKPIIGNSPAAAVEVLQKYPQIALNPTQGPIKQLLGQAINDTSVGLREAASGTGKTTNPIFTGVNPKDKGSVSKAINDRSQQLLDSYGALVNPNDPNNPYQIASINQLYANSPTVRDLPVVRKVLAPIMKTGMQLDDPKRVMQLVSNAVLEGKVTHREALEISTVYHVGVKTNLAMRNFDAFGLKPTNRYNATIEINPDAFTSTAVVDMTRPDQVSRALMKIQAGKVQKEFMEGKRDIIDGRRDAGRKFEMFDSRGVAPDSMFQPNPAAANALDAAADSVGPAVENFFKKLPKTSDFEAKAKGSRTASGIIRPAPTK